MNIYFQMDNKIILNNNVECTCYEHLYKLTGIGMMPASNKIFLFTYIWTSFGMSSFTLIYSRIWVFQNPHNPVLRRIWKITS